MTERRFIVIHMLEDIKMEQSIKIHQLLEQQSNSLKKAILLNWRDTDHNYKLREAFNMIDLLDHLEPRASLRVSILQLKSIKNGWHQIIQHLSNRVQVMLY